jgi:hypothetical protein
MKEYKATYKLSPAYFPDRRDALQMRVAELEFYFKAKNGDFAIKKATEIKGDLSKIPYVATIKLEELVEIKDVHSSGSKK